MENIYTLVYGAYEIIKFKRAKKKDDYYGNIGDDNFYKKLINDLSHCKINTRFEEFDSDMYLRLIDININHSIKEIIYSFDLNIISSEFIESDIDSSNMEKSIDEVLKNIPFKLKRKILRGYKNRREIPSLEILDQKNYNHKTTESCGIFDEYKNLISIKTEKFTSVLFGKLILSEYNSAYTTNYSEREPRKLLKFRLNLADSSVNKNFVFNDLIDSISFEQSKLINSFHNKYLGDMNNVIEIITNSFSNTEGTLFTEHIRNVLPEEIYEEIKDINIEDVTRFNINIGE